MLAIIFALSSCIEITAKLQPEGSGTTIDAGDTSINSGVYDFDFKNRVAGSVIDTGAYEF